MWSTGGRHSCSACWTHSSPKVRRRTPIPPFRSWLSPANHYLFRDWRTAAASRPFPHPRERRVFTSVQTRTLRYDAIPTYRRTACNHRHDEDERRHRVPMLITVDSNVPLKPARNIYVTQHAPEFNIWGFYFFFISYSRTPFPNPERIFWKNTSLLCPNVVFFFV